MENASKALIIAGAILLSILLISLGIMVYNNAKGTISNTNLDTETVQTFNTKITKYCGTGLDGVKMNSLMDTIAASNGTQSGKATKHIIYYDASDCTKGGVSIDSTGSLKMEKDDTKSFPSFDDAHTYNATYTTDADGYINLVTITN